MSALSEFDQSLIDEFQLQQILQLFDFLKLLPQKLIYLLGFGTEGI